MRFWMTVLLSVLLGLMIFLIGTLDTPFRGRVSIGPGGLERVYKQLMDQHVSSADGALSRQALALQVTAPALASFLVTVSKPRWRCRHHT